MFRFLNIVLLAVFLSLTNGINLPIEAHQQEVARRSPDAAHRKGSGLLSKPAHGKKHAKQHAREAAEDADDVYDHAEGAYDGVIDAEKANLIMVNALGPREIRLVAGGFVIGVIVTSIFFAITTRLISNIAKAAGMGGETSKKTEIHNGFAEAPPAPPAKTASSSLDHEYDESLDSFWPRTFVLVIMLMVQSLSSMILWLFRALIVEHPELIFFLTMLVGLGGNASGQSVVLAVREIAFGRQPKIARQAMYGIGIGLVLAPFAFVRAYLSDDRAMDVSMVIAVSVIFIAMAGTTIGTITPKLSDDLGIDPGHTSPVVQVLMDMVGITIVCTTGYLFLDLAKGQSSLR